MSENVQAVSLSQMRSQVRKKKRKELWYKIYSNKAALAGLIILGIYALILIFGPLVAPYDPYEIDLQNKLQGPSMEHLMGTDDKGRDILSRILYGSYLTVGVGFSAVLFGGSIGILLGLVAGYYGGRVD